MNNSFPRMHVSLYVSDIRKSVKFYSQFFGLEPTKVKSNYAKFSLESPSLIISFVENKDRVQSNFGHLGFQMETLEELNNKLSEARKYNLVAKEEIGTNCCYAIQDKFWVNDPDNIQWEVYYFYEDAEFNDPHYETKEATACCTVSEDNIKSDCGCDTNVEIQETKEKSSLRIIDMNGHHLLDFYFVPLVCRTVPEIGCGSRSKPVLVDLEKINLIKEVWLDRSGLTVAIVWGTEIRDNSMNEMVNEVFRKHQLHWEKLQGDDYKSNLENFSSKKWYRSKEVDYLSREESNIFADRIIGILSELEKIFPERQKCLHEEISNFFYNVFQNFESAFQMDDNDFYLVKLKQVIEISSKYINFNKMPTPEILLKAVANRIIVQSKYDVDQKIKFIELRSVITCPNCDYQCLEIMPYESCQYFYECKSCGKLLKPLPGDCCVFCSYASMNCPQIQLKSDNNNEK